MLKQISRLALGASAMALVAAGSIIASTGPANAGPCLNLIIAQGNISDTCTAGADVFTFTFLSISGVNSLPTDDLKISGVNLVANDATLQFQIQGLPPDDVQMNYSVSGANLTGIDNSYGSIGDNGTISETACATDPCTSTSLLATLDDPLHNGGNTVSAPFTVDGVPGGTPISVPEAFISKDIENPVPGNFSEFTDSVAFQRISTPEPLTISVFGAGLLGIGYGAVRRRKAARKA